jgi:hypothetical protein
MRTRLKTWALWLLPFASVLCLLGDAQACAGGEVDITEETFFDPEIIGGPSPFFFDPHYPFYGYLDQTVPDFSSVNRTEWQSYFRGKLSPEAWDAVLYKAALVKVDHLIFLIGGKKGVAAEPDDAPFAAYADRAALKAALFYVGFAKRVEPFATVKAPNNWEPPSPPRPDQEQAMAKLIESGGRALASATSRFLQQRYALQLLRLRFYRRDWAQCLAFYDEHRDLFAEGSVALRAMGYQAGALAHSKRFAEANYLYSLLFDRSPLMALSALWSFHPRQEDDWKGALAHGKTPREKAVLWQMVGLAFDEVPAMEEIHKLDPRSDLLPLLLVRATNKAEMVEPAKVIGQTAPLVTLVDAIADAGDSSSPYLWDLVAGHLHGLRGEAAATRFLDRASQRAPKTEAVQRQLRASRFLARIRSDRADEAFLGQELPWLQTQKAARSQTLLRWSRARLAEVYKKKGDRLTSLCFADENDPLYADTKGLDRMIAFLRKAPRTPFDRAVAGLYPYPVDSLVEDQGLIAVYGGDVERAAAILDKVKTEPLNADPFTMRLNDCHDCDQSQEGRKVYTKAQAVRRASDLLRDATTHPETAAQHYLEVANALYNVTYYGNSRVMYVTADGHFAKTPPTYDCSHAEAYYGRAFEAAKDRELKARAAFGGAKCELGNFYNDPRHSGDFKAGKWFHALKQSLADTKYYREVLNECGYFRTFAER